MSCDARYFVDSIIFARIPEQVPPSLDAHVRDDIIKKPKIREIACHVCQMVSAECVKRAELPDYIRYSLNERNATISCRATMIFGH